MQMDAWLQSLLSALLSGVMVGLVVTIFKAKLDKSNKAVDENNNFKVSSLKSQIEGVRDSLKTEIKEIKQNVKEMSISLRAIELTTAAQASEQKFLSQRLTETNILIKSVSDRVGINFGKVVRKGE